MARRACICGICENVNLPSACAACVNARLIDKYKSSKKLSQARETLRKRVEAQLKAKCEADAQHHWRVTHAEQTAKLREKLHKSEIELLQGKTEVEEKQRDLDARSSFLTLASAQLERKQVELLGHLYPSLVRTQFLGHTAAASALHQKRRVVMRQLCKIFPLKRMTSSETGKRQETSDGDQRWSICNASLPHGSDLHSVSAQELGASLGYMVQLLNLSAQYLSAPLLHSAGFGASSSRVWQRTSYWDAAATSDSEEYPLFFPPQSCRSSEKNIVPDNSTNFSGFSIMENFGKEQSTKNFSEAHKDVQKGLKLLKRSVSCATAYGFSLLSSSVPSDLSTFEAFTDLMTLLCSKEVHPRSSRIIQHENNNSLAESRLSSVSAMEDSRQGKNFKVSNGTSRGNLSSANSFLCIGRDSDQVDSWGRAGESVFDGWDVIEHPTLPPPPSHSEDVEHWTRAMFIDATK